MAKKQPVNRIDEIERLLEAHKRMQETMECQREALERQRVAMEPFVPLVEKLVEQNRKAWDALATIYQSAKLLSPEAGDMVAQVLAVMADVTANRPAKRAKKSPAKKARKKPGTR